MSIGMLFWIIMILGFIFGAWASWPNWKQGGPYLPVFILLALLGWKVFGPAVHG